MQDNKPLTPEKAKYLSLAKSARKFCLTRCADGVKNVRVCDDTECPLHPYRFGRNPNRAGISGGKRVPLPENHQSIEDTRNENERLRVGVGPSRSSFLGVFSEGIGHNQNGIEAEGNIRINNNEIHITLKSESRLEGKERYEARTMEAS